MFLGAGAGEWEEEERREEKSWSAKIWLAESDGWNASQKTKSLRFLHIFELGRQSPPTLVSTLQHDVFATLNPAFIVKLRLCKWVKRKLGVYKN